MRRQKYFWFLESGLAVCLLASVFVALIALSTPVFAENLASTSTSEVVQLKLDHLAEAHKNDVDALKDAQKNGLETLGKRIDDALTINGQATDRFSLIVTILLGLFGLVGYVTVAYRAKAEAREAAEAWFKDNTPNLLARLEKLEAKAHDSAKRAQNSAVIADVAAVAANRRQLGAEQSHNGRSTSSTHSDDKDDEILRLRDQELRQQPENAYSFDDWNVRAHAAYASNQLADAVYFWRRALQVEGIDTADIAAVLVNKGVAHGKIAQGEINDYEDALAIFDQVIRHYGDAQEVTLRKLVAMALFNKGIVQAQMEAYADAIASFDEVMQRYGNASEISLQKLVVMALESKGRMQCHHMKDYLGAIASYDDLILRYGDASEVTLREAVAMALFNKGAAQGEVGKAEDAIASFDEIIRRYSNAPEAALREVVAQAQLHKELLANDTGA